MNEVCLDLSRLTVREREEYFQIKRQLSRIDASESMSEFAKQAWPTIEPNEPFVHGWHMDAIADHLSAVKAGQIRNLLITIPPRHTKSTQVSVMFPAWVWTDQPWAKFLFASHAHSLSERDSVKCRRLVESDWYRKEFGIRWKLRADQNTKLRFDNSEGGYRIATSVGGAVVGEGGDYIVVDDAHKPMEVYSDTMRDGVLKWWDVEFSTRANNPKTVRKIVIMQRLHENDLVGHLLEKGGWEHLCLPAEFDSARKRKATSIGWTDPRKDDGELLWPVRVGASELAELKRDLGDAASGQLDQDPRAGEGKRLPGRLVAVLDEAPRSVRRRRPELGPDLRQEEEVRLGRRRGLGEARRRQVPAPSRSREDGIHRADRGAHRYDRGVPAGDSEVHRAGGERGRPDRGTAVEDPRADTDRPARIEGDARSSLRASGEERERLPPAPNDSAVGRELRRRAREVPEGGERRPGGYDEPGPDAAPPDDDVQLLDRLGDGDQQVGKVGAFGYNFGGWKSA
jgi:hypothetical protein